MVKIRLRRMGAHKAPFYRVVVADQRKARDGKCIAEIGTYNPLTNPATISIDTVQQRSGSLTVHSPQKRQENFSRRQALLNNYKETQW